MGFGSGDTIGSRKLMGMNNGAHGITVPKVWNHHKGRWKKWAIDILR
jgi:hypothetical protein